MVSLELFRSSSFIGAFSNHDDERRVGRRCPPAIITNAALDFKSRVYEEQRQRARKKHMALEIVNVTVNRAAMLVLLIKEANFGELLIASIMRGLAPNQSGPI